MCSSKMVSPLSPLSLLGTSRLTCTAACLGSGQARVPLSSSAGNPVCVTPHCCLKKSMRSTATNQHTAQHSSPQTPACNLRIQHCIVLFDGSNRVSRLSPCPPPACRSGQPALSRSVWRQQPSGIGHLMPFSLCPQNCASSTATTCLAVAAASPWQPMGPSVPSAACPASDAWQSRTCTAALSRAR